MCVQGWIQALLWGGSTCVSRGGSKHCFGVGPHVCPGVAPSIALGWVHTCVQGWFRASAWGGSILVCRSAGRGDLRDADLPGARRAPKGGSRYVFRSGFRCVHCFTHTCDGGISSLATRAKPQPGMCLRVREMTRDASLGQGFCLQREIDLGMKPTCSHPGSAGSVLSSWGDNVMCDAPSVRPASTV